MSRCHWGAALNQSLLLLLLQGCHQSGVNACINKKRKRSIKRIEIHSKHSVNFHSNMLQTLRSTESKKGQQQRASLPMQRRKEGWECQNDSIMFSWLQSFAWSRRTMLEIVVAPPRPLCLNSSRLSGRGTNLPPYRALKFSSTRMSLMSPMLQFRGGLHSKESDKWISGSWLDRRRASLPSQCPNQPIWLRASAKAYPPTTPKMKEVVQGRHGPVGPTK
jgi:hypothetical protein